MASAFGSGSPRPLMEAQRHTRLIQCADMAQTTTSRQSVHGTPASTVSARHATRLGKPDLVYLREKLLVLDLK